MKIEYITKEKAESLIPRLPAVGSFLPLIREEMKILLITEESFPVLTFNIAVVEDGKIIYITDEKIRENVKKYLENV